MRKVLPVECKPEERFFIIELYKYIADGYNFIKEFVLAH